MRPSLLFALATLAAPVHSATLSGTAVTRDGEPLPQVTLRLVGPSGARAVVSGAAGRFRADVEPGTYRLESALPGLVVSEPAEVRVTDDGRSVQVTLVPAPVREHVVVAAVRGEAPSSTLGVTVSALDHDRIVAREVIPLVQLLQDVPGVAVNRSGPLGRQATVFVRGGASGHTRVLVDGIPVNEPGGFFDHGSLLGLELQQVEVVRGAASSLYGSDALAGLIAVQTRRPAPGEPARAHLLAEGGSFGHRRGQGGVSGRSGRVDWNLAGLRVTTDNEGVNSTFRETAGVLALGVELSRRWSLQLTARGSDSFHGTPGQTAFGVIDHDSYFERTDVVSGLRLRGQGTRVRHELRAGLASSDQVSVDPASSGTFTPRFGDRVSVFGPMADFPNPAGFQNDTRRVTGGYLLEYDASRHLLSAGVDVERESGDLGTRGQTLLSPTRSNAGVYVQDRWTMAPTVFLTVGARLESNDSFGTAVVPRAALSWIAKEGGGRSTRLKASAGTGIKEPGFFESFGTSEFALGNPDLKAERSRTFDAGVEQRAWGGRVRVEATGFQHDYLDQIAYQLVDPATFRGTFVNLGRTRARGLELEMDAQPRRGLRFHGQYTYTDSEVVVSTNDFDPLLAPGKALLRRPRHTASFTAEGGPASGAVTAAMTVVRVGARADSDFAGLGLEENEDHTRVDARLRARAGGHAEVFAVAENLLDADYQEVLGYPALGRSLRFGLRLRAGR